MENDPRHTAVHEAGHAVIGRMLGMLCGSVSIVADDSAGQAIIDDPWMTLDRWWLQGHHHRDIGSVLRGRILAFMAGAEAEVVLLGSCQGGDGDDRHQIAMMLASRHAHADDAGRLRRAARMLCRRHADRIRRLADALLVASRIDDEDEICRIADIPEPPPLDNRWIDESAEVDEPVQSLSQLVKGPSHG